MPNRTAGLISSGSNAAAQSIIADAMSNYYVSGIYGTGTRTLYNSSVASSALTLPSTTGTAAFAAKYNSTGTATWAVGVTGIMNNSSTTLSVDKTSNIYLMSTYTSSGTPTVYDTGSLAGSNIPTIPTTTNKAALLVKYNSNAQAAWVTSITNVTGTDIDYDASNNIIVTGTSTNGVKPVVYDASSATINVPGPWSVSTLAGTGSAGNNNGTGTFASFYNLSGIDVDSFGNIFVSDTTNYNIRKITPAGVVTTFAGGTFGFLDGTGTLATFYSPQNICIDSSNNIYVADYLKIRKITSSGVVTTIAGSGSNQNIDGIGTNAAFSELFDITIDSFGNLYVTSSSLIKKITPSFNVSTFAGNDLGGYADGTGTNAKFSGLQGIDIDSNGNLYVCEYNSKTIRKITSSGVVTTVAGSLNISSDYDGTGTNAGISTPIGIAIDKMTGLIYFTSYDRKVRKFDPVTGIVTTIAGNNTAGNVNGTGDSAQLYPIYTIGIDRLGSNIYVTQPPPTYLVRKVTNTSTTTTTNAIYGSSNVFLPTPTNTSAIAVKYNSNGVSQWSLTIDGASSNESQSVVCDSSANVFLTGRYGPNSATMYQNTTIASGITNLTATSGGTAVFGIKTNSNGIAQWAIKVDGTGTDSGLATACDTVGNFYIAGSYQSSNTIITSSDNSSNLLSDPVNTSTFLAKFSSAGINQWITTVRQQDSYGSNLPTSMAIDGNNNIYLAGFYSGIQVPTIMDSSNNISSILALPLPLTSNTTCGYMIKYDSNGTPQASIGLLGGLTSCNATALGISVDNVGSNIYIAGVFKGQLTLYDANSLPLSNLAVAGLNTNNQSAYIANYSMKDSPIFISSSLSSSNNGQQKYVTNIGGTSLTINILSSNQSTVLSSTTLTAGSTAVYTWYNTQWYKF
jgi:hypothetical protein